MRRKSERNKSKSAAEKKPAETTPRKARRSSRRRKRSSSHSSSEDSDDAPLKPAVVETQEAEVPPPSEEPKKSESRSNSDEDKQEEQPIWKVKTTEAPSGEIQKLKICLQRPPTTPERTEKSPRRRRGKASSQSDDASLTPEEKPQKRKTRRSSPITQTAEGSIADNKLIEEAEKDECLIIVKETNEVVLGKGKLDCSQTQESENPEYVQDSQAEVQPVESLIESKIEQDMEQDSAPVNKDTDETQEQTKEKTVEHESLSENPVAEQMEVTEEIQKDTTPESEVQNLENAESKSMDVQEVLEPEQPLEKSVQDTQNNEKVVSQEKVLVENTTESSNTEVSDIDVKVGVLTDCEEQQKNYEDTSKNNKQLEKVIVDETKNKELESMVEENLEQPQTESLTVKNESISEPVVQTTETKSENLESKEKEFVETNSKAEVNIQKVKEVESNSNIETPEVSSKDETPEISSKDEISEISSKDVEMTDVSENSKTDDIKLEKEPKSSLNNEMCTSAVEESKSELNKISESSLTEEVKTLTKAEIDESTKEIKSLLQEESKSVSDEDIHKIVSKDESKTVLNENSSIEEVKTSKEESKSVLNTDLESLSTKEVISSSKEDSKSVLNEDSKTLSTEEIKSTLNDESKVVSTEELKTEPSLKEESKSILYEESKVVANDEPESLPEDIKSSSNDVEKMDDSPIEDQSHTDLKKPSEIEVSNPLNTEKVISPNDEKTDDSPERIIRKRSWGKYHAPLIEEQPITFSVMSALLPSLKMLNLEDVKLDNEEPAKEQKITKKEREVTVQPFQSPKEEDSEKEISNIGLNRKISIVNDDASKLQPPPSPAKNPVSSILYITNLVRPFTIKQLQELLSRTGKIIEDGFWTDKIKSKCYVQYETEEEAEATRNALHGVQWPTGNGKKLIIDFGTLESMTAAKNAIEPPVTKPVIEKIVEKVPEHKKEEAVEDDRWDKPRAAAPIREWDLGKVPQDHRDRSRSRDRNQIRTDRIDKKRQPRTESPSNGDHIIPRKKKKEDTEVKMMDDLFHKTKATPSIYWLPLSPEQIAKKQQQRLQRMAEHKRRMEESRRMERDFGRGAPRSRRRSSRYDGD